MIEEPTDTPHANRTRFIISGICLFLAVLLILLFLLGNGRRPLKPIRLSPAAALLVSNEASFITFPDLNADPTAYLDQFIRVSGQYTPQLPPTCLPHNGPDIRWALINNELQLDAVGFETILRELPAGTILTVEGIWRRYHGPFGCGKQPLANDVWYLEVVQILEPNPLFGGDTVALDTILGPSRVPPVGEEPTPTAVPGQPTTTAAASTAIIAATETPTFIFTPTPTLIFLATESATTAVINSPTTTPTPGTPTPSLTLTITTSPTITGTPTMTPTITQTPTPGLIPPTIPVATPNPYQGPSPTAAYP